MKNSIKQELQEYIEVAIYERYKSSEDIPSEISDLHHELFNEDYYIIGYYQAEQWLEKHGLSAFAAISEVQEYEEFNFGEKNVYDNAEKLVNMLVYIYGEQFLYEHEEEIYSEVPPLEKFA